MLLTGGSSREIRPAVSTFIRVTPRRYRRNAKAVAIKPKSKRKFRFSSSTDLDTDTERKKRTRLTDADQNICSTAE